ncbi:MAG: hypothetical protein IT442_17330 [Phycisphaeraceae bacterium]|nr:hypothetical protein [Phycisphaeraceae bacterium]
MLRSLFRRLDLLAEPTVTFDEVRRWPAGVFERFTQLRLLREAGPSRSVVCDGCPEGHVLDVAVRDTPAGPVAVADCPTCGRVAIPLDRLRQWAVSFAGLADVAASATGATGGVSVQVPDRLAFLGLVRHGTQTWDLFLARGLAWANAATLCDAPRLRAANHPVVLVPDQRPIEAARLPLKPALGSLTELMTASLHDLTLDLTPLSDQTPLPHPDATTLQWLTVSDAAKLHLEDVDGLTFERAKGRISMAATKGCFKTNDRKGNSRRIDRNSFFRWRLEQRDQNLDNYDNS